MDINSNLNNSNKNPFPIENYDQQINISNNNTNLNSNTKKTNIKNEICGSDNENNCCLSSSDNNNNVYKSADYDNASNSELESNNNQNLPNSDNTYTYEINSDLEKEKTEKEAIELLKSQHKKIKKLQKELTNKEKIISEYKSKCNLANSNKTICIQFKQQIELLNKEKEDFKIQLYAKDKEIMQLKTDLNDLSKKFKEYSDNLMNQSSSKGEIAQLNKIIQDLQNKNLNNEQKIKTYENQFEQLNKDFSNQLKQKQKIEILYEDKMKEEKNWIEQINRDIKLLCQWLNSYMGVYFDKNITIPDVPIFTSPINSENALTFNKFNLDDLRNTIADIRNKIYNKQLFYENTIENSRKEQMDLMKQIENLNNNITDLNKDIITLKEEIARRNFDMEEMKDKFSKTYRF